MSTFSWNAEGFLPPVNAASASLRSQAPYLVTLGETVERFATSKERIALLDGYLRFRSALHGAGVSAGFQWLAGDFFENVERNEGRAPDLMTVVSFFELPTGQTQAALQSKNPSLFSRESLRKNYNVDAYFVELKGGNPTLLVEKTTFWYGRLAHRRDYAWKGLLRLDLDPTEDAWAMTVLISRKEAHA